MDEFALINQFFRGQARRADVELGVGDDAAIVSVPPQRRLVISTDTLTAGTHFPENFPPADLGYRALAAAISDLAAMGATPAWATLALTLPAVNQQWLAEFSNGFFTMADAQQITLIGGDTTRGALSITVTVHGFIPHTQVLLRSGAQAGEDIYVSGALGAARLALDYLADPHPLAGSGDWQEIYARYARPQPRVALAQALLNYARCAIDISDGLLADLTHILQASACGAELYAPAIPVHPLVKKYAAARAMEYAVSGGDDYELCFTAAAYQRQAIAALSQKLELPLTRIGTITARSGELNMLDVNGAVMLLGARGYQHF